MGQMANDPLSGARDGVGLIGLDAPGSSEDLWSCTGSRNIPAHRMLMQGDVITTEAGPICIISHACSIRRGTELHDTQIVAPIREHPIPQQHLKQQWNGNYDWIPLSGAPISDIDDPAAYVRELRSDPTTSLLQGDRIAVMSDTGIHLLQQRIAHHLCRTIIDLKDLAEHSAPVLAEVELHEEWVEALGPHSEDEFHRLLDADGRKLRNALNEARTRPETMRNIRREIQVRKAPK